MRIGIDIETTCGQVNTIQYGTKDKQSLIRPYKKEDRKALFSLMNALYDENNEVIGYNILGFDIPYLYIMLHAIMVKLDIRDISEYKPSMHDSIEINESSFTDEYEYEDELIQENPFNSGFRPFIPPFRAHFIDLMLHVKTDSIYAPYALSLSDSEGGRKKGSARCISRLKKVHDSIREKVAEKVLEKIVVPKGVEVQVSYEACKGKKGWSDIKFILSFSAKLKSLISYIDSNEQTIKMEDFEWVIPVNEKPYDPFYGYSSVDARIAYRQNEKIVNTNPKFKKYALKDIEYLFKLESFIGKCEENDNDIVVGIVAYTRYHGFELDRKYLVEYEGQLQDSINAVCKALPDVDLASPVKKLAYLHSIGLTDIKSTSAKALAKALNSLEVSQNLINDGFCLDMPNHSVIKNTIEIMKQYGALAQRRTMCHNVLDTCTGRLHPDLKVIGAASGRMSGCGGINVQGIPRENTGIRRGIKTTMGGDYGGQELSVAAYVYHDANMEADIKSKFDLHLNILSPVSPWPYDEMVKIKKDVSHPDHYKLKDMRNRLGKTTNFMTIYGGGIYRLIANLREYGILDAEKKAEEMLQVFMTRYTGFKTFTDELKKRFVTLEPVYENHEWENVEDAVNSMEIYIENALGFKRHWAFENQLIDIFINFDTSFIHDRVRVIRSENKGKQTLSNSVKSACLGASIGIQRAILRQATNHQVQSLGAGLTKKLMIAVWKNHEVPMLNIHDEVIFPDIEDSYEDIKFTVDKEIQRQRELVSTLSMDFVPMLLWSDKE